MLTFITKRAIHSAVSLAGVVMLVFFLARLTGNPADLYLEVDATVEIREQFMRSHGLDRPVYEQFVNYISDLAQLDFGSSIRIGRPVIEMIGQALPTTMMLACLAMTIAIVVAVTVGCLAAFRPDGVFDRIATVISLASVSIPGFWLAMVCIMVFSVHLRLLPTSGIGTASHWIMPVLVLAIRPAGLLVQLVKASMVNALDAPFIRTAKAKGIEDRSIVFIHALRNAVLPVVTVAGDEAAGMINGALIVELIFNLPGIGSLLIDAIKNRDFAVIQGTVMITAAAIFLLNVIVDLIYVGLDPRIRY